VETRKIGLTTIGLSLKESHLLSHQEIMGQYLGMDLLKSQHSLTKIKRHCLSLARKWRKMGFSRLPQNQKREMKVYQIPV